MTIAKQDAVAAPAKQSPSSEEEDSVPETLAERRALHNSVERSRREALNAKFTHLAQIMPTLSHIHRPSKSVIISHCLDMVADLRNTKLENERLKKQLNSLRMNTGLSPRMSQLNDHHSSASNSVDSSLSPPLVSSNRSGRINSPSKLQQSSMSDFDDGHRLPASAMASIQYRHSISGPAGYVEPSSMSALYPPTLTQLYHPFPMSPPIQPPQRPLNLQQAFDMRAPQWPQLAHDPKIEMDAAAAAVGSSAGLDNLDVSMNTNFYGSAYPDGAQTQQSFEQFTYPPQQDFSSSREVGFGNL